jgi:short-subunit dehydrogenase
MRIAETAEEVVETALRGLKRHKSSIVSGWTNKLMVFAERFVPRAWVLRITGKVLRQRFE